MTNYRQGTQVDIERVRAFLAAEGELSPVTIGSLAQDDLVFWLAIDGTELLGAILTRPQPYADGKIRGGVDELAVAASRRNQGIGRRLMELAETHYRDEKATGMLLTVVEGNGPAVHLYESLGYKTIQHRLRMTKDF